MKIQLESPGRSVPFELQVSALPYFHPRLLRSCFREWSELDRWSAAFRCAIRRFLATDAASFFENSFPSTPEMGGCAFAGTSNKLDNRSAMLCIRVRRCASAAAAALRVWSIAPSSPLRDPGNPARTPLQPPFSRCTYTWCTRPQSKTN